jgi:Uma2 family endonuclease
MAATSYQPSVTFTGRLLTIADVAVLPSDLPSGPMKYELNNGRLVSGMFTIADVAVMPRDLPSGPVDYELNNGVLTIMSPTGRRHGVVQSRIAAVLTSLGDDRGLGETAVETGIILWRGPDRLVGPDVAYWSKASFPLRESSEGYVETIPDLIFEVRSKNDTNAEIQHKVADYLAAGVKHVLVVDPEVNTIALHRVGGPATMFGKRDMLRLDDLIPGCSISLSDLFRA